MPSGPMPKRNPTGTNIESGSRTDLPRTREDSTRPSTNTVSTGRMSSTGSREDTTADQFDGLPLIVTDIIFYYLKDIET